MDYDVVVVGAGAAGLVATERAASRGLNTLLLEKNRKPGVKILMSGGTRCNLTHATDARGIVTAYGTQGKFLHSALAALGPDDVVALVENEGVETKVEETGKIFPASNHATDVLAAFMARLRRTSCEISLDEPLEQLRRLESGFELQTSKRTITSRNLIITVGGKSYPGCGTRGDGYAWARQLGHTVIHPTPALVPLTTGESWIHDLKGLTLPDVRVRVVERMELSLSDSATGGADEPAQAAVAVSTKQKGKRTKQGHPPGVLDERRGSFLFTHFGFSGPVVLDVSRAVTVRNNLHNLMVECDFVPAISAAELEESFKTAAANEGKKSLLAILPDVLPRRLAEVLLSRVGLTSETRVAELSKAGRANLVAALKGTQVSVSGTRGFEKAEVTAGGVSLDEVDSRSMQSKLVPDLYWAGEVLDLDGPIGGYNFQAAFSTGWLAGMSV
ncbi:MAG: NAD(P)/FAD-dependent oxidoreductase [Planctomycetota bacterium]|nr:NAD(P)/FAD-dependent oxidoreductase [Planctomycetota bacterium]